MKAFEEWFWNEYDPHDDSFSTDSKIIAAAGWRAALQWVNADEALHDILKKELEEE